MTRSGAATCVPAARRCAASAPLRCAGAARDSARALSLSAALRCAAQAVRGLAPGGHGDSGRAPTPQGDSADDLAWLDVEGAVAAFLPDALHSDAGWQVPLGSYPAPVRAVRTAPPGRSS